MFASSPLQRCLLDVHTVTQHVFVAPPTYEMLGKNLPCDRPTAVPLLHPSAET